MKKMNRRFSRRAYHVRQVMAWGYTRSQALTLCQSHDWFGDTIAATKPSGRQYRGLGVAI